MENQDPRHNPAEAMRLIRETLEAGRWPTRDEEIEFITRKVNLGYPIARKSKQGKRGPKPRTTQYDEVLERWRDRYRRLVKLPKIGKLAKHPAKHNIDTKNTIYRIADEFHNKGIRRHMAKLVLGELYELNKLPTTTPPLTIPDVSTIRKILKNRWNCA